MLGDASKIKHRIQLISMSNQIQLLAEEGMFSQKTVLGQEQEVI